MGSLRTVTESCDEGYETENETSERKLSFLALLARFPVKENQVERDFSKEKKLQRQFREDW